MYDISIIGAGAWGTALAALWAGAGSKTALFARDAQQAAAMHETRQNSRYLPGVALPPALSVVTDISAALQAGIIVMAVPAQSLRETLALLKENGLIHTTPLVLCNKGIELGTGLLMAEVVAEVLPGQRVAVLSGPNFAGEVARGLPTASVIACEDAALSTELVTTLSTPTFRLYAGRDITGAEVAGAVKNVLAIACGIAHGRKLGENARAALIARGLAEIKRLAVACGGNAETLSGLAGVGDIVLTCSSPTSRNMSFGVELGLGGRAEDILRQRQSVVEGVPTAAAVLALAERHGVEMPIARAVKSVLAGDLSVDDAIRILLERPLRGE